MGFFAADDSTVLGDPTIDILSGFGTEVTAEFAATGTGGSHEDVLDDLFVLRCSLLTLTFEADASLSMRWGCDEFKGFGTGTSGWTSGLDWG